jgi:hypothetical protein
MRYSQPSPNMPQGCGCHQSQHLPKPSLGHQSLNNVCPHPFQIALTDAQVQLKTSGRAVPCNHAHSCWAQAVGF